MLYPGEINGYVIGGCASDIVHVGVDIVGFTVFGVLLGCAPILSVPHPKVRAVVPCLVVGGYCTIVVYVIAAVDLHVFPRLFRA